MHKLERGRFHSLVIGHSFMRYRAPTAAVAAIESILSFAESQQAGARTALIQDLRLDVPDSPADARVPSALIPKLLGRAGGRIKGGRHLTYAKGTPVTNLFLNMPGSPVPRRKLTCRAMYSNASAVAP